MFEKVKLALRLKSAAFDDEITGLIAAAIEDLRLVGVSVPDYSIRPGENVTENSTNSDYDETDNPPDDESPPAGRPRVERAIILYCKSHFGYNANTEGFLRAYELLKSSLHFERGRANAVE